MIKDDDLIKIDFETASEINLKYAGAVRYADDSSTRAIVLAYAIGSAPAKAWHANGKILDWSQAPEDLRAAWDSKRIFGAWNVSFDSMIWNYSTLNFPYLEPARIIDIMIQAGVSNLPLDLQSASTYLGGEGKQINGKNLIKLFSEKNASPAEYPEEWQEFLSYARQDVDAMTQIYRKTRPLPLEEWKEYWAFEHINKRGVTLDMKLVRKAKQLAAEAVERSGHRLAELTGGEVTAVTQAERLARWLHRTLPEVEMRDALMAGGPADDDDETTEEELIIGAHGLSLTRDRVAHVLAMLEAKKANGGLSADEDKAIEAATLRLYGAGASPRKFASLEAQQTDGVLRGQYRFAGAGQTGRMTSRGAQIQNLTRDTLNEAEAPLIGAIVGGCSHDELEKAQPIGMPVARKLALLVRPAIVAAPGKVFVWSDWSAIEARITPWLTAARGAEVVLDIFRANDRDPSMPDIYTVAAVGILNRETITKSERQLGKVTVLALGFGGGTGALTRMALNYGIHLDDAAARNIVRAWREWNRWAQDLWSALWEAALDAWDMPGCIVQAERCKIAFEYHERYLGGSLFMALPSGRLLTYPQPRWRDVEVKDKKTGKPTGEKRTELSFRRARGRTKLWHGTLCENAVQATAADILRQTVTRITNNPKLEWMPIRMTTHDEIVCECDEGRAAEARSILRAEMLTVPAWAEGLPLQSEESIGARYTKAKTA